MTVKTTVESNVPLVKDEATPEAEQQNDSAREAEQDSRRTPSNRSQKIENPFDPRNLRLSQDFASSVGVKKALLTIPRRKPDKQWFIRVRPEETYRLETALLEVKEDREFYLLERHLWADLPGLITPSVLFTAINRSNVLFILPVTLPDANGRHNEWHRTLLECAVRAQSKWVQIKSNQSFGGYEAFDAAGDLAEPEWPDISFQRILEIAFKDSFIRSDDHPVLRKLRGEI